MRRTLSASSRNSPLRHPREFTGDLLHADADGVLVIPADYQGAVVEAAILSRDFETRAHTYGRRSDKSVDEKRRFVGALDAARAAKCKALLE